jgi:hypothetical protein
MMLTSLGELRGQAVRCRELGVAAILTKPIARADLPGSHDRVCRNIRIGLIPNDLRLGGPEEPVAQRH